MLKHRFFLLGSLWVLGLMQGCHDDGIYFITPTIKSQVTITLDNKPVTLHFEILDLAGDRAKPFRELLEKLERKEEVDLNKPTPFMPLEEAIEYGLGERYRPESGGDTDFYAARYLLFKGADPNAAIHRLCRELRRYGVIGKRSLVLLLSYGARLDLPYKDLPNRDYMALKSLEEEEPWIPQHLRNQYEKPKKEPSSRVKEESVSSDEDDEEEAPQPPAWKTAMPQEEQQRLKREYFTDIAEQLLKEENNRGNRLHPSFVKYLEEKTPVDRELIERLKAITAS